MKLKIKLVLNIKKQYTREMKFIININDTTPYNDIIILVHNEIISQIWQYYHNAICLNNDTLANHQKSH